MKISLKWLNDYIDLSNISSEEIADKLTMATCEVDKIEKIAPHLEEVIIAEVVECDSHPNADKLSVCKVNTGSEILPIVCGAPNVAKGQKIALAREGVVLPGDFKIKKAKIRGQESRGMICSEKELDLSEEAAGIMVLPEDSKTGASLSKLYSRSDTILDIDNKSITHRPDLWGHYGFAKELSAIFNLPIKNQVEKKKEFADKYIDSSISNIPVSIEEGSALAYCGMIIENLTVKPSPSWMQERLLAVGARPINNLVDISNFVMLELGQPNHTFDRNDLGKEVRVYTNKDEIEFETLDEAKHKLPLGSILIGDEKRAVAIGGIMGGKNSEVSDNTTTLFLESATFPRDKIRKTLSATALRTDAAVRFEKGLDPLQSEQAIYRFIELLAESCPEIKTSKIDSQMPGLKEAVYINVKPSFIRERLGQEIPNQEIKDILTKVKFEVEILEEDLWKVKVPSLRQYYDVGIAEDLIEEVGRQFGYDNIVRTAPLSAVEPPKYPNVLHQKQKETLDLFIERYGYSEAVLYSFMSKQDNEFLSAGDYVEMANPVSPEFGIMRTSLAPALIRAAILNQNRFENFSLLELGRSYHALSASQMKTAIKEKKQGGLFFLTGERELANYNEENNNPPFSKEDFHIAGLVMSAKEKDEMAGNFASFQKVKSHLLDYFSYLRIAGKVQQNLQIEGIAKKLLHPGLALEWKISGTTIGYVGLIHPKAAKYFSLKRDAIIWDIDLTLLWKIEKKIRKGKRRISYAAPSVFPEVDFEFTILLEEGASSLKMEKLIRSLKISEIQKVEFLSAYKGAPLEDNQEALSYKVTLGSRDETLNPDLINEIRAKIVEALEGNGFPLRS